MMHINIDSVETRNVVGFECGTRADFDIRHYNNPLWVFVDKNVIKYQVLTSDFLLNPRKYYFDTKNFLRTHRS